MSKKEFGEKLIKCIFVLVMGVQIALGVVWILENLLEMPRFGESRELVNAAQSLVMDEYVGVLYVVLILLFQGLEKVLSIPFQTFLYLLQLAAALGAYVYLLKNTAWGSRVCAEKKWSLHFLAAYILTFAPILQGHMAVLPYSLASSAGIMLLTELKKLYEEECCKSVRLLRICVVWAVGGLVLPDFAGLLGIVVFLGLIGWVVRRKRCLGKALAAVLLTTLCLQAVFSLTQMPGSMGRIQKTVGAGMVSRFVWPYFERNSFFWGEEVRTLFEESELGAISLYPEKVIYEFGPKLEAAVGRERANEIYWEMAVDSVLIGKKEALSALGRDLTANLFVPFSMQLQLHGNGTSYTGWNYGRMADYSPVLTKYYTAFSLYGFDLLMVLGIFLTAMEKDKRAEKGGRKNLYIWRLTFFLTGIITIWYTFWGNGMQDYLKMMLLSVLWCFWVVRSYGVYFSKDFPRK